MENRPIHMNVRIAATGLKLMINLASAKTVEDQCKISASHAKSSI